MLLCAKSLRNLPQKSIRFQLPEKGGSLPVRSKIVLAGGHVKVYSMAANKKNVDTKVDYDWNHPLIQAGLWPDAMVREVIQIEDFYQWLKRYEIPYRIYKGVYWVWSGYVIDWVKRGGDDPSKLG